VQGDIERRGQNRRVRAEGKWRGERVDNAHNFNAMIIINLGATF
jgi:hypothetical protein